MQGNVSWEMLSLVVGAIFTFGCGVAAVTVWLWNKLTHMQRNNDTKMALIQREHDQFRVETANKFQEYVSVSNLARVEERIESAIKDLRKDFGEGFDRVVDIIGSFPRKASRSKS
jgi:hypothetical protein